MGICTYLSSLQIKLRSLRMRQKQQMEQQSHDALNKHIEVHRERPEFASLVEFVPPSYALFYITLNCCTCKGEYYQLKVMSMCQTVMHSSFAMVLCVSLFCFTLALNRKAQEGKHPICILLEIWANTPTCESLLTPVTKMP